MSLSEHFSLEELTFSSSAERLGIDNNAGLEIVTHLTILAQGLEKVRSLLGAPLRIDSGYRCEALNAAIGGAKNSAHMQGFAADFLCPQFGSPTEIVKAIIASDIDFDQVIQEGTWVHISFAPTMRHSILTAHFAGGVATYTQGA